MSESISVLVVDDHPLFRQGVVHSLGAQPGLAVIGEAAGEPVQQTRLVDGDDEHGTRVHDGPKNLAW